MKPYLYQQPNWPHFTWNTDQLWLLLSSVRNSQGRLIGKMEHLGFDLQQEANLETLALEVLKSTEIEGEILDADQVRSSLARRLGLEISGLIPSDRNVDGIVDMMLDATIKADAPLTKQRLLDWHYSLFPTGRSGMYKIIAGNWRDDSTGPMQVVSGPLSREKVHFQAPDAANIDEEMEKFLDWLNHEQELDLVIKAGIAHLWFLTIHPFEDGNGRIARAITDMLLTRADGLKQRFYSMSNQIRAERNEYYTMLEKSQKGTLDITNWLLWFLNCLQNALLTSDTLISRVLDKHQFWQKHASQVLNARQVTMLNRLLDSFTGKLTSSKWAKITKTSSDTALRDIQDLINKGILRKEAGGGRSTNYELNAIK